MSNEEFRSNCLIEAIKAKIRNPNAKILYIPGYLNEVPCPHWMWSDDDGEHDFHFRGRIPWYKWLWHKGTIRTVSRGSYKQLISEMIQRKFY